jgi:hypothetical protein
MAKKEIEKFNEITITATDITKFLCPTATEKEVYMALNIIKSYQLNPFKREVHIIKYGTQPAQVVVGYEVYLKRAERTGQLNGWETTSDEETATCTIYRKDWDKPLVWTISKKEFDKGQASWKSMPDFMLKKVAIAQAFRLAFPDELGGLPYLKEEIDTFMPEPTGKPQVNMPQAIEPQNATETQETPKIDDKTEKTGQDTGRTEFISEGQIKKISIMVKELAWSDDYYRKYLKRYFGVSSKKDLSMPQAIKMISLLEKEK